jgi:hypothetical protein
MDDDSWNQMLEKKKEKAPKWIEIIRNSGDALGLEGVSHLILMLWVIWWTMEHDSRLITTKVALPWRL